LPGDGIMHHNLPSLLQQLHHLPLRRNEGINPRRLAVQESRNDALGCEG
jgi:hypothetical protein